MIHDYNVYAFDCPSRYWVWFQEVIVTAKGGPPEAIQPAEISTRAVLHWPGTLLHQLQEGGEFDTNCGSVGETMDKDT